MLSHVLPVLRLARKKSNALFLGQIVQFTHREITPKIFKCANYVSYETQSIPIVKRTKPEHMHTYIIQIFPIQINV